MAVINKVKEVEQSSLIIKGKHNNCITSLIVLLVGRVHAHWPIIILILHSVTRYLLLITRSHTVSVGQQLRSRWTGGWSLGSHGFTVKMLQLLKAWRKLESLPPLCLTHGGDWPVLPVGTWPLLLGSRATARGCFRGGLQMSLLLSVLSTVGLAWSQAGSAVGYSTCFHVS